MKDCQFGVSPVNYSDSDPIPSCLGASCELTLGRVVLFPLYTSQTLVAGPHSIRNANNVEYMEIVNTSAEGGVY